MSSHGSPTLIVVRRLCGGWRIAQQLHSSLVWLLRPTYVGRCIILSIMDVRRFALSSCRREFIIFSIGPLFSWVVRWCRLLRSSINSVYLQLSSIKHCLIIALTAHQRWLCGSLCVHPNVSPIGDCPITALITHLIGCLPLTKGVVLLSIMQVHRFGVVFVPIWRCQLFSEFNVLHCILNSSWMSILDVPSFVSTFSSSWTVNVVHGLLLVGIGSFWRYPIIFMNRLLLLFTLNID